MLCLNARKLPLLHGPGQLRDKFYPLSLLLFLTLQESLPFHESLVYALLDFYPVGLGTLIEKSPYGLVEILPVLERLEQKEFIQETIPNYYIKTI